jgi:hypothetical protein
MKRAMIATGLVLLALLSSCATEQNYHPAPGEKMHVSEKTMRGYQKYLDLIGSVNPGAFAVSTNGRIYEYWYCADTVCSDGNSMAIKALRGCEKYGEKCYLFAKNRDIKVDYEVVP